MAESRRPKDRQLIIQSALVIGFRLKLGRETQAGKTEAGKRSTKVHLANYVSLDRGVESRVILWSLAGVNC